MRVLFQGRINLFSVPGGDTVQIVKTMEHLKRLGIDCELDISVSSHESYEPYDLVHLFNFTRIQETYWFARLAKGAGKPVVLSTIYWDNTEVERLADVGWRRLINRYLTMDQIEYLKGVWRFAFQKEVNHATIHLLLKGFRHLQKETLQYVDYFLPNSEIEMELFQKNLGQGKTLPYLVVPNGVDVPRGGMEVNSESYEKFKDGILCVGRIDGRKNQLNLVKALKDFDFPVVFVGQPAPNHSAYMRKIRNEARAGMYFLGQVPHEHVTGLYRNARVHVCPSWYETPGLASLEAGAAGCNIVVTDKGSTKEYFKSYAFYCEPDSVSSIRDAVLQAYHAPRTHELKDLILKDFTWAKAAEKTVTAYEVVLGQRNRG